MDPPRPFGGESWELVFHVSETCGAVDLELHPANPDMVYACMWETERKPWTVGALFFAIGLVALGSQILWARFLALLVPNTVHTYTITTAIRAPANSTRLSVHAR